MKTLIWLERITIVLIFIYQFANKSPDEQLMGIDKENYFIILGVYSFLLLMFEIYFIKTALIENTISFKKNNPEKFDLLVTIIFLGILSILFLLNTTIKSHLPILNYLISTVYAVKAILGIVLYRKLSIRKNDQ